MPNDPHSGGCVDADYNPIPCGDDNEPGGWNNYGGGWYDDDGNYHSNNEPNIPSFPSEVSVPGENTPTAGHGNFTPGSYDPRFSSGQNGPNGPGGGASTNDKGKGGGIFGWLKKLFGSGLGGQGSGQQNQGYQMLGLNDIQKMIQPKMQMDTGGDYYSRLFQQNKQRVQQPFQWGGFDANG